MLAIIAILVALVEPTLRLAGEAARRAAVNATSVELKEVAERSVRLADRMEEMYRKQKALLAPVAEERAAIDRPALQLNLERLLRAQRQLDQAILPALRRIEPSLGRADEALARELREHLEPLSFHTRRDILLKRFLLEGEDPDGASTRPRR